MRNELDVLEQNLRDEIKDIVDLRKSLGRLLQQKGETLAAMQSRMAKRK